MPNPETTETWDRECVICGHKWLDGPQEDGDCPACCQRRRVGKNTPRTPIREAVWVAIDSATHKTNNPRIIEVDAFFEVLAESGYEVVKTTANLQRRIDEAAAALQAAPDLIGDEATNHQARDVARANRIAWAILTQGWYPESVHALVRKQQRLGAELEAV